MIGNFFWNEKIFFYINSFAGQSDYLDIIFIFLAKYLIFIIIIFYVFYFLRLIYKDKKVKIQEFFILFLTVIFAFIFTEIFKIFIQSERPFSYFQINTLLEHSSIFTSFPSGHTTLSFALAFSIFAYKRSIGLIFLGAAFLVGLGRILVGVHYPVDIVAGGLLGFFSFLIAYQVIRLVRK